MLFRSETNFAMQSRLAHVRSGSLADMATLIGDVRYTPKSGHGSERVDVRFVPIADITPLFNHLVGTGEQRRRHGEAERLGGPEVDHQVVSGRGLHRQVGRLVAL